MMKKSDLLKLIERAIEAEDKMAEHTANNVASALQWYDCSEAERRKIKSMLATIASDSRSHAETLAALKLKVEKDAKEKY